MPAGGKSNVFKVNVGWAILIAAGVGSFVLAKNMVLAQRQETMRKRQAIAKQIETETSDE